MYQIKQNKKRQWVITPAKSNKELRIFDTLVEAKMYADEHYGNDYEIDKNEPVAKKKHPLLIIILIILILGAFLILYFTGVINNIFKS